MRVRKIVQRQSSKMGRVCLLGKQISSRNKYAKKFVNFMSFSCKLSWILIFLLGKIR